MRIINEYLPTAPEAAFDFNMDAFRHIDSSAPPTERAAEHARMILLAAINSSVGNCPAQTVADVAATDWRK